MNRFNPDYGFIVCKSVVEIKRCYACRCHAFGVRLPAFFDSLISAAIMQSRIVLTANSKRAVKRLLVCLLPVLLLLGVSPGVLLDGDGWRSGFRHPLLGYDHLLTMLAVGIWAAQLRGHAIWQLPLTFVAVMSLGGLAGAAGVQIPLVEGVILLSCVVFAVLISRRIRFNAKINVLLVAFFAFFHGYAHGQEISTSASLMSYTAGFMLATLLLHGAGIVLAKLVLLAITGLLAILFSSPLHAASVRSTTPVASRVYQPPSISNDYPADSIESRALSDSSGVVLQVSRQSGSIALIEASPVGRQIGEPDADLLLALFKDYFPFINYTPGLSLLSSGVGLASPPRFDAVVPPPVVSCFHPSYFQAFSAAFSVPFDCLMTAPPRSSVLVLDAIRVSLTPCSCVFGSAPADSVCPTDGDCLLSYWRVLGVSL